MEYILEGFKGALKIIFQLDREFLDIVAVSLKVACISTLLAAVTGVPLGILIAQKKFPGRNIVITVLNTLMSLPTVVVGLTVYSFLSRKGPLGEWGLLYTLSAMIIGQFILAFPILSGFTITAIRGLDKRIKTTLLSMGFNPSQGFKMFIHEARLGLLTALIAGFGRVFAEVGVSMMLGGNIKGYTRNIPTTIALETSKGEFALGIALGIVLLTVAFSINLLLTHLQKKNKL